jgi:scyllo-inositol 2-dehydrogenase (NADP+)
MRIAALATSQGAKASALVPEATIVTDLPALLSLPHVQVVVLTTPNGLHEEQTRLALTSDRVIVVDKPLVNDRAGAERLLQLQRTSPGRIAVFHNRRWDSDFLTVRRMLSEERLGQIHTVECCWDRYRPEVRDRWRERNIPGAGVLLDLGTHLIDQALVLFGRPMWVEAEIFRRRTGAVVDDAFDLRLAFDGLRVRLAGDTLIARARARFSLHGARGSFTKHGLDAQESQLLSQMSPVEAQFGWEPESSWGTYVNGASGEATRVRSERGDWLAFYRAIKDGCLERQPVPITADAARATLEVIDGARQSNMTGQRVWFESP